MILAKRSTAAGKYWLGISLSRQTIATIYRTNWQVKNERLHFGKEPNTMRRPLIPTLLAVTLWLLPLSVRAQERLNFAYISPNAGSSSVLWVAKEAGVFKKHGLDVNVIYIEGTPKALMSLIAGELQIVAGTGPAVASAKVRGADVSMVMGFEVFLPYYLVAAPTVKSIEGLKGKVGANHSAATSADFAMRLGLRNIGLDPDKDVSLRVVGATNLRMIMMQQKQADFTVISSSEREEAEKLGFKVLVDLQASAFPIRTAA